MVASGTAFAQGLTIAITPILTRIYNPNEFGIAAAFAAVLTMLGFAKSFSYEIAIPVVASDDDAKALLVLCFGILALTVTTIALSMLFWGDRLLATFNAEPLVPYKYLIPLGYAAVGAYVILSAWMLRIREYKAISYTQCLQAVVQALVKVCLGLLGAGPSALVLGNIFGRSAGISKFVSMMRNRNLELMNTTLSNVFNQAKRNIEYLLFTTPKLLINDACNTIPVLGLTYLYGLDVVGLYGMANVLTRLPSQLIGYSVGRVFYAEAAVLSRNGNNKELKVLMDSLFWRMFMFAFIPTLIIILVAPLLFTVVLGAAWREAGIYARILSISAFAYFVTVPFHNIFEIFRKQKIGFYIILTKLFLLLFAFGIACHLQLTAPNTIMAYSLTMALLCFMQYRFARSIVKCSIKRTVNEEENGKESL